MNICTRPIQEGSSLPLVVEPKVGASTSVDGLIELIEARRDWLDAQLAHHGGVLFRGFEVKVAEEFQRVALAVTPELKPYVEGQSPRQKVNGNVYTSTEYPPQYPITMHSELSYAKTPPNRILFYCNVQPQVGGETPIADCRRIYREMDADLRSKFESKGVLYVKNMHGDPQGLGKSWMEHFETSDRSIVEGYMRANEIDFEWAADNTLRTKALRPAVRQHAVTGETVWYNQANLWHVSNFEPRRREQLMRLCGEANLPTHAYFGDGSPISDAELDQVRGVMNRVSVVFPWQQGDVLVLDNILSAHGRRPYQGPRKILVAMN